MDRHSLHDHYQKRMDAIADRFYKAVGLATVVFFGFAWTIFSADKTLQQTPLVTELVTLAGTFIVIAVLRNDAIKALAQVQEDFETEFSQLNGQPAPKLVGLFP